MINEADYDAIIVGGGHNGLVTAWYLARGGLSVLLLEHRDILGGACITEELIPGYRFSACSYICHLLQAQVIDDLKLRRHGFEVFHLDPNHFHPFPAGRGMLIWDDIARTQDEIARFSKHDAKAYPRWLEFWDNAAGIIHRHFLKPPPTMAELSAEVRGTAEEPVLEQLLTTNMRTIVTNFFENDAVQGAFIQAQDVGDVRAPGSALCYAHIKCNAFSKPENFGVVKGGMGGITQAMARATRELGVDIQTNTTVSHIIIEQSKAHGVVLSNGTHIRSRIVISNADPKRTFLHLIRSEDLENTFVHAVKRLKTNTAYLKFHAALSALPDFSAHLEHDTGPHALAAIKICPSIEYYERSWKDAKNGRPSQSPIMEVQIPSVYDPTMAPAGHHVLSIWVMYAPVHLCDGTWEDRRTEVGEHLIDTLTEYAPNFRDVIVDWDLFTPPDIESRVGMTDGNIRHLDIVPGQYLAQRPMAGWSNYRTPLHGLYLCGAGTHPGGEVTGAPGHNAAHVILEDWERVS